MFKRILVAVDASQTGELALRTAIGLAAESRAQSVPRQCRRGCRARGDQACSAGSRKMSALCLIAWFVDKANAETRKKDVPVKRGRGGAEIRFSNDVCQGGQTMKTSKTIALTGLLIFAVLGTSCGTVTGAAVGAGAGAAIGAGTDYGAKKGALIGTGVGAAAGAIYDITK